MQIHPYQQEYKKKCLSADAAAQKIASHSTLLVAMAVGAPPALLKAISQQIEENELKDLKVYYKLATKTLSETLLREEILPKINANTFFITGAEHSIIKKQQQTKEKRLSFVPCHFSQIPRLIREIIKINTFIVTVSPMDKAGYFSLGTNNDYSSTAARHCDTLIVEVNPHMPRVFGQSQIHISEIDAIVANETPLFLFPSIAPAEEDLKIGKWVAPLVPDRATLQLGLGKVPSGIALALEGHQDLGIHSELFSNTMVDLIEKGVATGKYKTLHPHKHVYTVALGDKRTYDFLNDNSAMESYSSEYVNGIATIASHDNLISINTAIEIDLYGQVNAEFISDHEYSGSGGQYDFVKGAALSKGGKSIIALHSTALQGKKSTLVPKVEMVTDTRMDVEYVVTEYGVANLRGKSTKERALALIEIAHPDFRNDLLAIAEKWVLI